ncbi:hypothetical protein G7Y89_g3655 [Cudoniella acicularis]|uniref:Uncharacterized protein n=1 Tax=Cudoniella acicularis TaxID=354080 RepID=A0A8H4RRS4_9HELO|nr:hypothetical protein G7Y89_g3655 [Cudoniella acicularis]
MRLRQSTRTPGRYLEDDDDNNSLPQIKPIFVVLTVPYDPTLPAAAFPTISLGEFPPARAKPQPCLETSEGTGEDDIELVQPPTMQETLPALQDVKQAQRWEAKGEPGEFMHLHTQCGNSNQDASMSLGRAPYLEGHFGDGIDPVEEEYDGWVAKTITNPDGTTEERCFVKTYELHVDWQDLSDGAKLVIMRELTRDMSLQHACDFLQFTEADDLGFVEIYNREQTRKRCEDDFITRFNERQTKLFLTGAREVQKDWDALLGEELRAANLGPLQFCLSEEDIQKAMRFLSDHRVREEFPEEWSDRIHIPTKEEADALARRILQYAGVSTSWADLNFQYDELFDRDDESENEDLNAGGEEVVPAQISSNLPQPGLAQPLACAFNSPNQPLVSDSESPSSPAEGSSPPVTLLLPGRNVHQTKIVKFTGLPPSRLREVFTPDQLKTPPLPEHRSVQQNPFHNDGPRNNNAVPREKQPKETAQSPTAHNQQAGSLPKPQSPKSVPPQAGSADNQQPKSQSQNKQVARIVKNGQPLPVSPQKVKIKLTNCSTPVHSLTAQDQSAQIEKPPTLSQNIGRAGNSSQTPSQPVPSQASSSGNQQKAVANMSAPKSALTPSQSVNQKQGVGQTEKSSFTPASTGNPLLQTGGSLALEISQRSPYQQKQTKAAPTPQQPRENAKEPTEARTQSSQQQPVSNGSSSSGGQKRQQQHAQASNISNPQPPVTMGTQDARRQVSGYNSQQIGGNSSFGVLIPPGMQYPESVLPSSGSNTMVRPLVDLTWSPDKPKQAPSVTTQPMQNQRPMAGGATETKAPTQRFQAPEPKSLAVGTGQGVKSKQSRENLGDFQKAVASLDKTGPISSSLHLPSAAHPKSIQPLNNGIQTTVHPQNAQSQSPGAPGRPYDKILYDYRKKLASISPLASSMSPLPSRTPPDPIPNANNGNQNMVQPPNSQPQGAGSGVSQGLNNPQQSCTSSGKAMAQTFAAMLPSFQQMPDVVAGTRVEVPVATKPQDEQRPPGTSHPNPPPGVVSNNNPVASQASLFNQQPQDHPRMTVEEMHRIIQAQADFIARLPCQVLQSSPPPPLPRAFMHAGQTFQRTNDMQNGPQQAPGLPSSNANLKIFGAQSSVMLNTGPEADSSTNNGAINGQGRKQKIDLDGFDIEGPDPTISSSSHAHQFYEVNPFVEHPAKKPRLDMADMSSQATPSVDGQQLVLLAEEFGQPKDLSAPPPSTELQRPIGPMMPPPTFSSVPPSSGSIMPGYNPGIHYVPGMNNGRAPIPPKTPLPRKQVEKATPETQKSQDGNFFTPPENNKPVAGSSTQSTIRFDEQISNDTTPTPAPKSKKSVSSKAPVTPTKGSSLKNGKKAPQPDPSQASITNYLSKVPTPTGASKETQTPLSKNTPASKKQEQVQSPTNVQSQEIIAEPSTAASQNALPTSAGDPEVQTPPKPPFKKAAAASKRANSTQSPKTTAQASSSSTAVPAPETGNTTASSSDTLPIPVEDAENVPTPTSKKAASTSKKGKQAQAFNTAAQVSSSSTPALAPGDATPSSLNLLRLKNQKKAQAPKQTPEASSSSPAPALVPDSTPDNITASKPATKLPVSAGTMANNPPGPTPTTSNNKASAAKTAGESLLNQLDQLAAEQAAEEAAQKVLGAPPPILAEKTRSAAKSAKDAYTNSKASSVVDDGEGSRDVTPCPAPAPVQSEKTKGRGKSKEKEKMGEELAGDGNAGEGSSASAGGGKKNSNPLVGKAKPQVVIQNSKRAAPEDGNVEGGESSRSAKKQKTAAAPKAKAPAKPKTTTPKTATPKTAPAKPAATAAATKKKAPAKGAAAKPAGSGKKN